jgi:LPS sulfotransferase NodH
MKPDEHRAPFLVMAHHRSGSNFLNDLLQTHVDVECLNEPLSMHTCLFRDNDLSMWEARDFDLQVLHPSLADQPSARAYLFDLRRYLMQSRRGRILGFKDTCVFGKLGWLQVFLPGLKVIFLRRDARAIVSSVLRSKLASFWHYADLVPPVFAQLCPAYTSQVEPLDTALRAAETAAMSVAVRYELARRELGSLEHLVLDLEDLTRDPLPCLRRLAGFLGVEGNVEQATFIAMRQSETRGGLFSSFRSVDDIEQTWKRHLSARQVAVIDDVMLAMHAVPAAQALHA